MSLNKKILVIDDEQAIRRFLRVSLEGSGYTVKEAANGRDGIREAATQRPDLIILDLGLPDIDGVEVIKKIREWSKTPILVLTVRGDEESKVRVLDVGADDYLTKPFGVPELLARLRVAERHVTTLDTSEPIFKTGPLEVDMAGRIVKVEGKEVHLTSTEYAILCCLVKNAGKVVTHRQILKEVWGPNSVEHTQYLRVYVGHLRRKIEPDPESARLIMTETGVGYRLLIRDGKKE